MCPCWLTYWCKCAVVPVVLVEGLSYIVLCRLLVIRNGQQKLFLYDKRATGGVGSQIGQEFEVIDLNPTTVIRGTAVKSATNDHQRFNSVTLLHPFLLSLAALYLSDVTHMTFLISHVSYPNLKLFHFFILPLMLTVGCCLVRHCIGFEHGGSRSRYPDRRRESTVI